VKQAEFHELDLLVEILPTYTKFLRNNLDTTISHFLGAYVLTTQLGTRIPFVVMSNVFFTSHIIHERYDLKGSWENRRMLPKNVQIDKGHAFEETLKDTDLRNLGTRVQVPRPGRQRVLEQIKKDVAFLKSQRIMDYSLLLGIHHKGSDFLRECQSAAEPYQHLEGEHRIYYFGIIDTLQRWNWQKRLEKFCKTYFCMKDGLGVSSVDPKTYCERFILAQEDLLMPKDAGTKYVRQSQYGAINNTIMNRSDDGFERQSEASETQSVASDDYRAQIGRGRASNRR